MSLPFDTDAHQPTSPEWATQPFCALCSAIPLEIFRRLSARRGNPSSFDSVDYESDHDVFGQGIVDNVLITTEDCSYQHYSGPDALMDLERSSEQGCPLCIILWSSLKISRQSLPTSIIPKAPKLPGRLPAETGITLHSFDDSHFIVRDDTRWSLVRFSKGYRVNEKGCRLHENAYDEEVFELIQKWISECTERHHSCTFHRLNCDPGYVPARLIWVRPDPEQEPPIHLSLIRTGDYEHNEDYDYVSLSHCWGSDPELVPQTTMANHKSRTAGIGWDDLSKTFQDAIETTFKLGKSYIWIDSLCIVQDDPQDVAIHTEFMRQIYSNSFCTIAATGAKDGTEGCFLPRDHIEMKPCVITPVLPPEIFGGNSAPQREKNVNNTTETSDPPAYDAIVNANHVGDLSRITRSTNRGETRSVIPDHNETRQPRVFTVLPTFREWTHSIKGPLLSRGWTLQERELSVRVLHYTADRVVWECRQHYASEEDPTLKPKSMQKSAGLRFRLLDGSPRDRKNRPYNYKFAKWKELVEDYSTRKLSLKEDKLRAITGLADAIKSIQQDDVYLSGIWKRDFGTELLWNVVPKQEDWVFVDKAWPTPPVFIGIPSWSWAAHDGAIVFDRPESNETSVISAHITKANSLCLTLSGISFKVPFLEAESVSVEVGGNNHNYYKWSPPGLGHQVYITFDSEPESQLEIELVCLAIVQYSPRVESSQSGERPPAYTQSSSGNDTQNSPYRIWDGERSATGLVLIPESGTTHKYRRVGMFQATGTLPATTVKLDIV